MDRVNYVLFCQENDSAKMLAEKDARIAEYAAVIVVLSTGFKIISFVREEES